MCIKRVKAWRGKIIIVPFWEIKKPSVYLICILSFENVWPKKNECNFLKSIVEDSSKGKKNNESSLLKKEEWW